MRCPSTSFRSAVLLPASVGALMLLAVVAVGVPRGGARGVAQTSGWGAAALRTSPNGTRVAVTGAPESAFEATAPNGVRVVLDVLPETPRGLRDAFSVH